MITSFFQRRLLLLWLGLALPAASQAGPALRLPARHSAHFPTPMSPLEPATLRRHYEAAATDKAAGEKFYQLLADYQDKDALVLAYKGAAQAIRARDAAMLHKLEYVKQAAHTFEQAVALDSENAEIRFLRFSVESNLPAFLGLSKHLDEDRTLLLRSALAYPNSDLDAEAFRTVRNFLVVRGHVSEQEARQLSKAKA
ncbi:hypothetical protein [uncultured Hymenobacter sp.]|uniref:hypothetical protein n=1 Tax=uncultured Hymenobacter sp. TaxID=170016 RepID=UPI0035CBF6CA